MSVLSRCAAREHPFRTSVPKKMPPWLVATVRGGLEYFHGKVRSPGFPFPISIRAHPRQHAVHVFSPPGGTLYP